MSECVKHICNNLKYYHKWYFHKGDIYYTTNGFLHREDGPALIFTYNPKNSDAPIRAEIYLILENIHREDGPAHIEYFQNGPPINTWFYHNQEIKVKSQEEFERYIKLIAFT